MVNPTVGLPLFLGSVTAIALLVHGAILLNTNWYPKYWEGGAKKAAAVEVAPVAKAIPDAGFTVSVSPVAAQPVQVASAPIDK